MTDAWIPLQNCTQSNSQAAGWLMGGPELPVLPQMEREGGRERGVNEEERRKRGREGRRERGKRGNNLQNFGICCADSVPTRQKPGCAVFRPANRERDVSPHFRGERHQTIGFSTGVCKQRLAPIPRSNPRPGAPDTAPRAPPGRVGGATFSTFDPANSNLEHPSHSPALFFFIHWSVLKVENTLRN